MKYIKYNISKSLNDVIWAYFHLIKFWNLHILVTILNFLIGLRHSVSLITVYSINRRLKKLNSVGLYIKATLDYFSYSISKDIGRYFDSPASEILVFQGTLTVYFDRIYRKKEFRINSLNVFGTTWADQAGWGGKSSGPPHWIITMDIGFLKHSRTDPNPMRSYWTPRVTIAPRVRSVRPTLKTKKGCPDHPLTELSGSSHIWWCVLCCSFQRDAPVIFGLLAGWNLLYLRGRGM